MTTDKLIKICFYVNNRLYEATVFLHRPTAVVIPDQNFLVYTNLNLKQDSSAGKDRYRKIVNPSELIEAKIDHKQAKRIDRSIIDRDGQLEQVDAVGYKEGQPFISNCRYLVVATPCSTMPR